MKCFHPQTYNDNVVACGRCPACRQNRINGWVVRLEKHQRRQESAHFITLTYADGEAERTKNGLLTLSRDVNIKLPNGKMKRVKSGHLSLFIKQLKNLHNAERRNKKSKYRISRKKITYYAAGEYGNKGARPHYHIILFNAEIDLILRAWSTKDKQGNWRSRGNVHTGDTSGGSIRYSLKYISKPSRIPLFHGDDRTPEFSCMSKGIGDCYLSPAIIKWHRQDLINRYYVPTNGGSKMSMPRYYADKIYSKEEKAEIGVHLELKSSEEFYKNMLADTSFLKNFIISQKWQEQKAFIQKQTKL